MHVILTRLLMLKGDMRKKLDEKSAPWPVYQPTNQSIINHTTLPRCTVETFLLLFCVCRVHRLSNWRTWYASFASAQ